MKTWLGIIVVAYKLNPLKILILENKQTQNITLISGAVEANETLYDAAIRELKEEVNWTVSPESLELTQLKQEFIYGPQKKDRAGDNGINQVLLLNADTLPDPQETNDTKNAIWVSLDEAQLKVSFNDLRDIIIKLSELLLH